MDDLKDIARLIDALRPWLGQLVIVGGWAHRLHRFHPMANPPSYLPLRTRDADLAFSLKTPIVGDIGAALRAADFREALSGENTPPVIHYRLGGDDQGFYAEFLVPLHGSGVKRNGEPADRTVAKAGVTAQKLRHLDLLLKHPFYVGLGTSIGMPLAAPAEVMLPNPVSFIVQKLLIQKRRPPEKQAQDALYIHDTLDLFGRQLEKLQSIWQEQIRPALSPKTARDVELLYRKQFGEVTDVLRNAVRIPQDRMITPARMQAACIYGLEQVFGALPKA